MDKIINRDELEEQDKWSIEKIYKNIDEVNKDLDNFSKELDILEDMEKDFLKDKEHFKNFLLQDELVSRLIDKLAVYTHCKSDEDKDNSIYQELVGKITNLCAKYEEKTSSVIPRMLKENPDTIREFLDSDKELETYRHYIEVILKKREHILSSEVEKVLSTYLPVFECSSETSSYLMNADLKFGTIKDEDNREVELSESNYSVYIRSSNRRVREDAFKRLYEVYASVKNTLTSTYNGTVNYDVITSRLRNYNSSLEMYLEPKDIDVSLYDNLIKTIRDNLEPLYEYYTLKKEILGLKEFHLYDGYAKIVSNDTKKYSFDEAKDLVLNALSVLGEDYTDKLKTAFSENWIDKYPNRGKRSGAYSTGSYDTIPYVLLNYTNTFDDVSTLSHELGHSMHTYYANKNNSFVNAGYPIFLAEIASTTNELLLSNYMYNKSTSRDEKLNILNERLDLFKATLYRQTMFAEYERNAHKYVEEGSILTSEYLTNMYYDLNKKYFGEDVVVDSDIKYECFRIPHFYTSFYVYQYATSLSISCYVADNIIKKTPGFREKYIELLSSGGKDYPLELLKIIDIDLTDNKVFLSAVDMFKSTLEDFTKVYYKK